MMQWRIVLSEFKVQYQPKLANKVEQIVDFITECSYKDQDARNEKIEWKLYIHGASNRGTRGKRIVLKGVDDVIIEYALKLAFKATNNGKA